DGIRDDLVTGVQTCALPILYLTGASADPTFCRIDQPDPTVHQRAHYVAQGIRAARCRGHHQWQKAGGAPRMIESSSPIDLVLARSEERRVGKEGRARGPGTR